LAGCGDDGAAADAGADALVDLGAFDSPDDFPRDGCESGAFAGLAAADVEGIYHLQIDLEGYVYATAARVDDLGGGAAGGVISGHDATRVLVGADDVLIRWADEVGGIRALDLCARDPDGTVRGHYARCTASGCYQGTAAGKAVVRLPEPETAGMTLRGEFAGPPGAPWPVDFGATGVSVNVRVLGDVAYVARYQDGLRIVDVADPTAMVELGHVPLEYADAGEIWNDVKVTEVAGRRYALMASNLVGVVVVDVTDPAAATIVAHLGTRPAPGEPINVHTLFLDGGKAYLANTSLGLEIWDLADPTAPVKLGGFTHPGATPFSYLHDLYVAGDRAYLNYWDLGMAIVDVADPAATALVGSFADYGQTTSHSCWVTQVGPRRIAVHGDEQWDAHVHIVDVTEGTVAFGNGIGEWRTRPEVSVHNIMAVGDRAYMAHYQDGVRVLDLSDPTAPREVAHFDTWPGYDRGYGYSFYEGAIGIDLDTDRGLIYVADSHRGLLVLHLE
ncbi:MAG: hypothetical protein KC464_01860, partial [Myxococcales bacterium]|nr:hypothetical protein [Myxococcales bacterium]